MQAHDSHQIIRDFLYSMFRIYRTDFALSSGSDLSNLFLLFMEFVLMLLFRLYSHSTFFHSKHQTATSLVGGVVLKLSIDNISYTFIQMENNYRDFRNGATAINSNRMDNK